MGHEWSHSFRCALTVGFAEFIELTTLGLLSCEFISNIQAGKRIQE